MKEGDFKNNRFLVHPEKRNHQRLNTNINVCLIINGKNVNTTASNISCGGLFLPVRKKQLNDKPNHIEMILHLPDSEKPVKVIGEISRFQPRSIFKRNREGVGIKFKGLYDDNILAIDRFIKNKLH